MTTKLLVLLLLVSSAGLSQGGGFTLIEEDSIALGVGSYRTVRFSLQEYHSDSSRIVGILGIEPDTTKIELLLFHLDDYGRWTEYNPGVDTLSSSRNGSGPVELEVPGFGWLVLVLSNRGNYHPAMLSCSLGIEYSGPGVTGDPLPSALRLALLLMMCGAVAIAIGGAIAGIVSRRKRRA